MRKFTVRDITLAALIAAAYVVLTFGIPLPPYAGIQLRVAEAMTVLPFLCPATAWGLFAGCILSNLLSPYGLSDLIFGSLATLLAGLLTARCKNRWLAPLPPVICNGLIVGALLAWYEAGFSAAFPGMFAFNALSVGGAELLVCYVLGIPLLSLLERMKIFPEKS